MNNHTERTRVIVSIGETVRDPMKTYVQCPARKMQRKAYSGPITLSQYERFQYISDTLANKGFKLPLPTGN